MMTALYLPHHSVLCHPQTLMSLFSCLMERLDWWCLCLSADADDSLLFCFWDVVCTWADCLFFFLSRTLLPFRLSPSLLFQWADTAVLMISCIMQKTQECCPSLCLRWYMTDFWCNAVSCWWAALVVLQFWMSWKYPFSFLWLHEYATLDELHILLESFSLYCATLCTTPLTRPPELQRSVWAWGRTPPIARGRGSASSGERSFDPRRPFVGRHPLNANMHTCLTMISWWFTPRDSRCISASCRMPCPWVASHSCSHLPPHRFQCLTCPKWIIYAPLDYPIW